MHIVAATDFSTRSHRAIRRAGVLARDRDADLTLVHVVDDDRPRALVALEGREANRILDEQIDAIAELRGLATRARVVEGAPHVGILQAARSLEADLIVMGTARKQFLRDILVGATVERVIRTGDYPVLMVNLEADRPYRTALAGVDMSAPSANAIRAAAALGLPSGERLTLVHAFTPLGKGKMATAGLSRESIAEYVAEERARATQELAAFTAANRLDHDELLVRIEEGSPFEVITAAAVEVKPDVVILGTHGRSGIAKALLGSVTAEVLRRLEGVDILAVPPDAAPALTA